MKNLKNEQYQTEVSVVLPVYNGEKYIESAIRSIMEQTFIHWELVIINDASQDQTLEICNKLALQDNRIKVFTNKKNLNIGGSLNKGISLAKAPLIARMDGDDLCLPTRLEKQFQKLQKDAEIAVLGTGIITINEKGETLDERKYKTTDAELKSRMLRYSPFAHPTVMFKKVVFEEFGGYDPSMSPSEDIDLWFKIGTKYKFSNLEEPLLKYRVFQNSHSNKKLREVEIKTLKMRWNAIRNLGYSFSIFDVIYNFGELVTVYFMPAKLRVWMFNFLRNRGII